MFNFFLPQYADTYLTINHNINYITCSGILEFENRTVLTTNLS